MEPDDLTLRVLIEIRDEIRTTRTDLGRRIDLTNQRIDLTNQGLENGFGRLDARIDQTQRAIVESELRTATAVTQLAGTLGDVHRLLRDRLDLRDRVERCERDIDELKRRVS